MTKHPVYWEDIGKGVCTIGYFALILSMMYFVISYKGEGSLYAVFGFLMCFVIAVTLIFSAPHIMEYIWMGNK